MGDPQGCRVRVDPVGDHAVVHRLPGWDLITGQQTHDARVPMVELRQHTREVAVNRTAPWWPDEVTNTDHSRYGTEELTDGMALKRWVMKEAPCRTASSAWDRLAIE